MALEPATFPTITVVVDFAGSFGHSIHFTGGQTVTCNGVTLQWREAPSGPFGDYRADVPRATSGQGYSIVYTDEHGTATTFVLPLPEGHFSLDGVTPHETLPIPGAGGLPLQYTNMGLSNASEQVHAVIVSDTANDQLTSDSSWRTAVAGPSTFTVQSATPFDQWMKSGPGSISLEERLSVTPPPQGFASVELGFYDTVTVPVIWSAPH